MKRLAALTFLCGILALNSGSAQDRGRVPAPDPAPVKRERASYSVRYADPRILAEVVGTHFRGEATLIAAPAGSGNAILINGLPTVVPEVVKLLEQLDRKPRTVEVEITIAEVPVPKDGKELTPADLAKAESLVKDGKGQRINLTAIEGQPVSSQIGGNKPIVTTTALGGGGGRGGAGGFGGGGPIQRSVTYHTVGTTVKATARVGSDETIALDLNVQDSKVRSPEADDAGAAAMENSTLTTKLSLPAGKAVVVQAVRTEGKTGATVAVVIVTARVIPDGPKNK